jgi:hypothetical protein
MTAVLPTVLNLFVAFAGHGTTMYVAPQIVAIIGSPDVGACPTTLITTSQPVYVCESPAEVKHKLKPFAPQRIAPQRNENAASSPRGTLIDGLQCAARTIGAPRNKASLLSARTNVSEASPSMSRLRGKGCQLTDCGLH